MSDLGTPTADETPADGTPADETATGAPELGPIKVSVVVPVYNPGQYLDDCISSLLSQTLPSTEYEAVFVDDGSTDETPQRLDQLAAEHANFRVIHIPNSGWPGRPRNLGTDAARGEYVQYVDQDDYLAPDALRRMYEIGHRNGSDIVIGKVVSNWRGVPSGLWEHNRDKVTIYDFPLWDSVTPHKMFRKAFLTENDIRFPEGKRRLEDQVFMMKAYFPARAVSIVGDYTCYFYWRRTDKANAGSTPIDPYGYYNNLREVFDVVEQNTEPGDFRDTILRRFYRVEMLGRVNDKNILRYDEDRRQRMFGEVHKLALERIPPHIAEKFPVMLRLRSRQLIDDDLPGRVELARRCEGVKPRTVLDSAQWRDGALELEFTTELLHADGEPLRIVRREGGTYLDPALFEGVLDWRLGEITPELGRLRTDVFLRERETASEWRVSAKQRVSLENLATGEQTSVRDLPDAPAELRPHIRTTLKIDPERAAAQKQLERGIWDVVVRVRMFGFDQRVRLGDGTEDHPEHPEHPAPPAIVGSPAMVVIPYFTAHGNLSIDVNRRAKKLGDLLAGKPVVPVAGDGGRLEVALAVASHNGTESLPVRVEVQPGPGAASTTTVRSLPALLQPVADRTHLVVDLREEGGEVRERLRAGHWQLVGRLDDGDTTALPLVGVDVDRRSRAFLDGTPRISDVRRLTRRVAHAASERPRLRRFARRAVHRLPQPVRARVKSMIGRANSG